MRDSSSAAGNVRVLPPPTLAHLSDEHLVDLALWHASEIVRINSTLLTRAIAAGNIWPSALQMWKPPSDPFRFS